MTKKDMEIRFKINTKCPFLSVSFIPVDGWVCRKCVNYNGKKESTNIIYCQKQGELKEKEAKR